MVFVTRILRGKFERHFLDKLRINVKAGKGGHGMSKYGGIGGRGGNIYAVGDNETTLKKIKTKNSSQKFIAGDGGGSSNVQLQGSPGADVIINCPIGISVVTDDGIVLGEVNKENDRVLLAKGGMGGVPSNHFIGEDGHKHSVNLDLKLIADIGLVGFPNAGKSTLIKSLSKTKPKIASYPFTTIEPRLATIGYPDLRQLTIADLPGLIEGAHMNIGMGHKFLKHIERTKIMLLVVDVFGFRLNPKMHLRSSFENVLLLNRELEFYKEELLAKPALLVINKMDIPGADAKLAELMGCLENMEESVEKCEKSLRPSNLLQFDDILTISAKNNMNTDIVKSRLREMLDHHFEDNVGEDRQEKEAHRVKDYFKLTSTEHINIKLV